jgi:hypothetical protein
MVLLISQPSHHLWISDAAMINIRAEMPNAGGHDRGLLDQEQKFHAPGTVSRSSG